MPIVIMRRKTLKIIISILVVIVVALHLVISQNETSFNMENIEAMAGNEGGNVGHCIYEPGFCWDLQDGLQMGMSEKI